MDRKNVIRLSLFALMCVTHLFAQEKVVKLKIVQTSDIHGHYYPCDFVTGRDMGGGLSRISSFTSKLRQEYGDKFLFLENGDILQGQPTSYYYNYIDTLSTHVAALMMNYMGYDVGNVGNHDIETGHSVFDRWAGECHAPILGANVINTVTGKTYFKPYQVFIRDGVKIVVLGMITPAIPAWLSENLWSGMRFDDMEETARRWMKVIREDENPDVIIGLFHAGQDGSILGGKYRENPSLEVARNVPGFDVVLIGHDHIADCKKVMNVMGDSVLIADPANDGMVVSDVDITIHIVNGKVVRKQIDGKLSDMCKYPIDEKFMATFTPQYNAIKDFVSKKMGTFTQDISTRSAYFGSSGFMGLIHTVQLQVANAEISLAAPLSFDAKISKGDISVSDMFNLYKYENTLYAMELTGKEVKGILEQSYAIWTNRMKSPKDRFLLMRDTPWEGAETRALFVNSYFNFDSAAGIVYTVDVSKPQGEKIHIISMADGSPFIMDKKYRVAVCSYRGNGGGGLITEGADIPQDRLKSRIVFATDKDMRYYLMRYIESKKEITPYTIERWKFIPEDWVKSAAKRDYDYLFGETEK